MTSLESACLALAADLAGELNGDLSYVPQEDIDSILSRVTKANVLETAEELAELAAWFN